MTVDLVIVTGGRDHLYPEVVHYRLDELRFIYGQFGLVHGACGWADDLGDVEDLRGADRHADEWARTNGIVPRRYPAYFKGPLGKGAGPARNARMVRESVNLVGQNRTRILGLAFPGVVSRGTWDCVTKMRSTGIQVDVWGPNRVNAWLRNKNRPRSGPN